MEHFTEYVDGHYCYDDNDVRHYVDDYEIESCGMCKEEMPEDRIATHICDKCFYKLVTFENCLKAGADKNFKDDYKYNAFLEWMFDPEELVDVLAKELKETLEQEKHFGGVRWTEKAMLEWAGNNADEFVEFVTD